MRKSQQGASYIAILLGIVVFAFIVKAVLALWPSYWDDRVINGQIEQLLKESSADITPSKFESQMSQRLDMNNIRDIKFSDIAKVSNDNGLTVTKKYEVRTPFFMNIDLVQTFEKSFDQRSVQSK
ncbi:MULTISPECIES: DUF4845 domain-containing protein [Acinetobacter]|uniref:DUF4845 domain-containing protein n=1 Tax=Acinetobacter piscicola TaxID=2006115 RepID=A0A4Q4H112_9GAMM|nr:MULTISPECIES: DUF4845 domain-containing protein [Acinetobacter]QOW45401.1 DUF4845 domain-containing protein [Acinetobacter piscicola]RYL28549.1 DUF4845 domain-containing protein [Acinetobacter piscicola]